MAIRLFLSSWQRVGNDIVSAIEVAQDEWPATPPTRVVTVYYWPDRDLNGEPDQPWLLARCDFDRGQVANPVTLALVELLDNAPGVRMLPKHRFQKPINAVPQNQRDAFLAMAEGQGIPPSHFAGVATWGEAITRLIRYGQRSVFGALTEKTHEREFE